jgi:hypothetical protein
MGKRVAYSYAASSRSASSNCLVMVSCDWNIVASQAATYSCSLFSRSLISCFIIACSSVSGSDRSDSALWTPSILCDPWVGGGDLIACKILITRKLEKARMASVDMPRVYCSG